MMGSSGAHLYLDSGGKSCHKIVSMPAEVVIERSCVTGRLTYYVLSSVLALGILVLIIIPIGSTFLYIDYKQQLAQRKSNKNDMCKAKCSFGAECIVDEYTSQSFCRCPLTCADDYEPVCGSDRTTHLNLCHLRYESCTKQQPISLLSNGPCDANLCDNVTCHRNEKCQVDERGTARCVCRSDSCSQGQPVCGSDLKLYGSLCELQKHACLHKLDLAPTTLQSCLGQAAGETRPEDTTHQLQGDGRTKCGAQLCSRPYAQCVAVAANDSQCRCPDQCPQQEDDQSICGTNQQSYASECEMRRDACLRQIDLKVLHRGQCGRCTSECKFYAQCHTNELGVPQCVCPQVCLREDRPVCGDNGVTYENECELRVASCRLQRQIRVRFNDSCDLCHNVACPYGATCLDGQCVCADNCESMAAEPLCANDGSTYRNECEMRRVACTSSKELIALFYGECEEVSDKQFEQQDNQLADQLESEPSSLAPLNLTPSECYHSYHTCRGSKVDQENLFICENRLFSSRCEMIEFKCRSENNQHKCAKYCQCSRHGLKAHSLRPCNLETGQCDCKEGLTGLRCDKCSPTYWNMQQVVENPSASGCKPCKCNKIGSLSEDCDKATGKCRCRPGVRGAKCDQCPHGWHLTSEGCEASPKPSTAQCELKCHHGAVCRQSGAHAQCSCQLNCPPNARSASPICASDGSVHASMCHFREHVCRIQKKLHVLKHCPN